jgi:hypothetical protein
MEFDAYRYYNQKRFKPNQVMECFIKFKSELQLPDERVSISGLYEIDDRTEETKDISITSLRTICEIKDRPRYIAFRFPDSSEKYGASNTVILAAFRGVLQLGLHLSGPGTSDKLFKVFEECLELDQCSAPEYRNADIANLEERLRNLEERFTDGGRQISCFLSYRFAARSKALALELTRFLQLLGVTVVSGAGYEPRRGDEKVITNP